MASAATGLDSDPASPSAKHWLGTDGLGRDTLHAAVRSAHIPCRWYLHSDDCVGIGLPIGAVAGYAGGAVDNILMRFVDFMYGFPDILLIILIKAILGGGIYQLFFAIGL